MEWVRGDTIGRGSFGTVSLVIPTNNFPQISTRIVVKSSEIAISDSLRNERQVLSELGNNHPHIIHFFANSLSSEKGIQFYNLFLEFAGKGSLDDHLRFSGGKFPLSDAKRYTKSILEGLSHVHHLGFAHCDIKLQNVLLFDDGVAKIADFGLAKRVSEKTGCQLRGTPLYMSPEIIAGGEVYSPADIWALGCAVVEMVSGKRSARFDVGDLLYKIGVAGDSPEIPENLCDEGRDFLEKCFAKDPNERWTARMLLNHPFLSGLSDPCCSHCEDDQVVSVSPRCPFEFSDWDSLEESGFSSIEFVRFEEELENSGQSSVMNRFEELGGGERVPNWSDEDGWVNVR